MLDAVVDYLPSPLDVPPMIGIDPKTGAEVLRTPDDTEPFSALAFKIAADPFVGKLAFFRVYSGTLKSGSYVLNPTKDKKERIGRILQMHANHREEIEAGLRGRHRRRGRAQGHLHGRHPDRRGAPRDPRVGSPSPSPSSRSRSSRRRRPTRTSSRSRCSAWPKRTRPSASTPTRSRPRPSSPAWASCTSTCSSTA